MKTAEKPSVKLKVFEIALLAGLAVFFLTGALALRAQDRLADKVVRLHVLANSDSEEDQALKLLVRDQVLERAASLLEQAGDRRQAEMLLRQALPELEEAAAREIAANGYDYPVTAELVDAAFPTKEYDGFTLPAGEYLALRVVIGQGAGHNWWCVVFPALCLPAAGEEDPLALLPEEQREAAQSQYKVGFKLAEWFEEFKHWLG